MHPTVTIKAERTICDLECMLPTGSGVSERVTVVKPCKLTLPHLGAAIVFNGDAITLFADDAKVAKNGYLLDHLVHFLIYSSRVDYWRVLQLARRQDVGGERGSWTHDCL